MTSLTWRRAALLALAVAGVVTAAGLFGELTHGSAPEGVVLTAVLVLIGVATAVGVHRGVPVPAAILAVPVTTGVTLVAGTYLSLLFGETDGQAALIVPVAIVLTLFLVPVVGAVAGLTRAIGSAVGRNRSQA